MPPISPTRDAAIPAETLVAAPSDPRYYRAGAGGPAPKRFGAREMRPLGSFFPAACDDPPGGPGRCPGSRLPGGGRHESAAKRDESMPEKHPVWTRTRIGRDRVHWVAYDDLPGAEGRVTVAQGYAATLREADVAARAALADAGIFGSRRAPARPGLGSRGDREKARRPDAPATGRAPRREYLYTRREGDQEGDHFIAAHLVIARTPTKVRVSRQSCGPDQIGTDDEQWEAVGPAIALDRARLQKDGQDYSKGYPDSAFYASRERARGDSGWDGRAALAILGIEPPCTVEDIKTAYRLRSLQVHPDRGGDAGDFRAVEDAYRRLLREAQAPGY